MGIVVLPYAHIYDAVYNCPIRNQKSGIFQDAGIATGVLQNAEDLAKDSRLAARDFFITLKHLVLWDVVSTRSALWDWRRKPRHWKSSPLLGQDNDAYHGSSF